VQLKQEGLLTLSLKGCSENLMEIRKILHDSAFFFAENGPIFNTMLSIIFKPPNLNNYTFFPVGN